MRERYYGFSVLQANFIRNLSQTNIVTDVVFKLSARLKGYRIYKRKDGRWEARYIRSYSLDGKAKYGYCYGRTYHEAKDKVNTARAALINHEPSKENVRRKRFAVFCDEWLRLKRSKVKDSNLPFAM